MSRASNVIPIGYDRSQARNTMMSTDTGCTMSSDASIQSHPPAQFFSADDILRNSIADDHPIERRSTYSGRHGNGDSVLTTITRASWVRRSYPILATTPVLVPVRAQPKIVTYGKGTGRSRPVPKLPALPPDLPDKPAEETVQERPRTSRDDDVTLPSNRDLLQRRFLIRSKTLPARGTSNYPIASRLSTISSVPSDFSTSPEPWPRPGSHAAIDTITPRTSQASSVGIETASPTLGRHQLDLHEHGLEQTRERRKEV
jgi:hypothetical protein